MKVTPKSFQDEAVAELRTKFALMQKLVTDEHGAVLLNAPTGSGKTLMVTTLIEELLAGSEATGEGGDSELRFLWLTDQPELNLQTYEKMLATSSVLTAHHLLVIDAGFDAEVLSPGKVYFLNTQKLGAGATVFNNPGDNRTYPLWQTLANTIAADPHHFVLILDEAHRGAKGREADEADTIMQRFMKGDGTIPAVPLVIGISATPDRFVKLCQTTGRTLRTVDVDPVDVRESGLLKEYVDLFHPDETQLGDATMLEAAINSWLEYCRQWAAYQTSTEEDPVKPVLLIQVADARRASKSYSETDLAMVMATLQRLVPREAGDMSWVAHAFQDDNDLTIANQTIRHLAPSAIDRDPTVRVVFFKTSLNTGWDCPRAETMVSFRSAKDETNIAQLVGRMVRTPLARLVEANEHLNTVALYLPYYDQGAVERVIARLGSDRSNIPPTEGRRGADAVTLRRNPKLAACFSKLQGLTSYTIPRKRAFMPVPRVGKLAALLAEVGWEKEPVKTYRTSLVKILNDELASRAGTDDFKRLIDEASVLDVRRHRHDYAAKPKDKDDVNLATLGADNTSKEVPLSGLKETDTAEAASGARQGGERTKVRIADKNVEDLYDNAGRLLGEGLHKEFLRVRRTASTPKPDTRRIKLELHALVSTPGVLDKLNAEADRIRVAWVNAHKANLAALDEKHRQTWRAIEGAGVKPEPTSMTVPDFIEVRAGKSSWPKHLYIDTDGKYHENFVSTWESRVVSEETKRSDIVGWLRNRDRKPWALCIARPDGTRWAGVYPDFIFFRKTKSGIICDIIDPHLLNDQNAPSRAAAIARYAEAHKDEFGRIELVLYDDVKKAGKRIDLMNEAVRSEVAKVTSHAHLAALFAKP
jgi:type III restriction enzyme